MKGYNIQWNKMHRKNYDGSCEYCGGACHNAASIDEWGKAQEALNDAEARLFDCSVGYWHEYWRKRRNYLRRKIEENQTYHFAR